MNRQISFEEFISTISTSLHVDTEEVSEIILELFTQIRYANTQGTWVKIQGLGDFHPLWYGLKKKLSIVQPDHNPEPTTKPTGDTKEKRTLAIGYHKRAALPAPIITSNVISQTVSDPSKEAAKQKIQDAWEATKLKHYEHHRKTNETIPKKGKATEEKALKAIFIHIDKYTNETLSAIRKIKQLQPKTLYISVIALFLVVMFLLQFIHKDESTNNENLKGERNQLPIQTTKLYKTFKDDTAAKRYTHQRLYSCTVTKGDSLYSISNKLYGNSQYWPLIYTTNSQTIKDMDRIFPKDILLIPRIPQGSSAQEELAKIYIQTYQKYKELGKIEQAHWLLYWGNKHIDKSLLLKYQESIEEQDREQVQKYLIRFSR